MEAHHFVQGKLNKIRMQYLGNTAKWSNKVENLLKENSEVVPANTDCVSTFINILCLHLGGRFPKNEIVEWSAFDITGIIRCDYEFGIEHVRSLCLKYKQFFSEGRRNY